MTKTISHHMDDPTNQHGPWSAVSTSSPPIITLSPASADDMEFAHDLTRRNMEGYVTRHWGAWSREVFAQNYAGGSNWILREANTRVGYVRLVAQPPLLVLDDLQIDPGQQRRGLGTFVLAQIAVRMPEFGCDRIRLRVFHDNAARRLYERNGFVEVERQEAASIMERRFLDE